MNEDKQDDKIEEQEEDSTFNIENDEDLIKMINQIMNETDKEPKVVIKTNKITGITIKTFNNIFVDYIYNLIINMGLILALCGWFKVLYCEQFYILIIFSFLFGTIDYWVKTFIYRFKPILFFKTLGYVFTLSSTIIISLLGLIGYLFFNIELNSAWILLGCYILFLVVRAIIIFYVKRIK